MGKWLAVLLACVLAARGEAAPREIPPIELELHQADAADLLHLLAVLNGKPMLLVRPAIDARIDLPRQRITPAALREQLGTSARLQAVASGGIEVWLPACAAPLRGEVALPKGERLTLNFDDVRVEALLRIIAETEGLSFDAPQGVPDVRLAVSVHERTTREVAAALANATGVDLTVDGNTLRARPVVGKTCDEARHRWITADARTLEDAKALHLDAPCGRLRKLPESLDFRCMWLESNPLADFRIRGFVTLSPDSPRTAYVEPPQGPPLLALPGDRFSEEFISVAAVGYEEVLLGQFAPAVPVPEPVRAFAVRYDTGMGTDVPPAAIDEPTMFERNISERYGLEDLLVESTRRKGDRWTADVRSIHGAMYTVQLGSYIGPDMGRIVAIDAGGLFIVQLRRDRTGAYFEEVVRLTTGAWYETPRAVLRRKHAVVEIDTEPQKDFVQAAARGDIASLESSVAKGAKLDARYRERNALMAAIDGAQTEAVRWLLEHGARPDGFFGDLEATPLTHAVQSENLAVVRLLLRAGADRNLADADAYAPLHHAAAFGLADVTRALLSRNADPRAIDDAGRTPALLSAYYGNDDVLKVFLRYGVRIDAADRYGNTLLGAAAEGGQLETARLLIKRGANVNALDRWNNSILDRARELGGNRALESLLIAHGARPGAAPASGSH